MKSLCKAVKHATAMQQAYGLVPKVNYLRNLAIKQAKEMGMELSWRNNIPRLIVCNKNIILEMYAAAQEYDMVVEAEPSLKDKMDQLYKLLDKVQLQLDNIREIGISIVREHNESN